MPELFKANSVRGEIFSGSPSANKKPAINPPIMMPPAKNRLHDSFLQLYFRKGISKGKHAAQIWRSVDETPSVLLPAINNAGTIKPIITPPTYQGQDCLRKSCINRIE